MYKKFASIANSAKFGYSFDSDKWEYRANPFLTQKFRMFETMGDGMTQHSHDWPVTEEYAIDYLFSLAVIILESPVTTATCSTRNHGWTHSGLPHRLSSIQRKTRTGTRNGITA